MFPLFPSSFFHLLFSSSFSIFFVHLLFPSDVTSELVHFPYSTGTNHVKKKMEKEDGKKKMEKSIFFQTNRFLKEVWRFWACGVNAGSKSKQAVVILQLPNLLNMCQTSCEQLIVSSWRHEEFAAVFIKNLIHSAARFQSQFDCFMVIVACRHTLAKNLQ